MTRRDAFFRIHDETFERSWNGERYDWTSSDGRLICWCSFREFTNGRARHEYSATLDGYPSTKTWPTLSAAMVASIQSRDAWDRRRAAA